MWIYGQARLPLCTFPLQQKKCEKDGGCPATAAEMLHSSESWGKKMIPADPCTFTSDREPSVFEHKSSRARGTCDSAREHRQGQVNLRRIAFCIHECKRSRRDCCTSHTLQRFLTATLSSRNIQGPRKRDSRTLRSVKAVSENI